MQTCTDELVYMWDLYIMSVEWWVTNKQVLHMYSRVACTAAKITSIKDLSRLQIIVYAIAEFLISLFQVEYKLLNLNNH